MTLLISENWRRALAALVSTVVLLALGIAIGSISSSSGSTSSTTQTVTATRTVTVHAQTTTTPAVSVLMPVRNEERSVAGAIRSVLEQSLQDLEILVAAAGAASEPAGCGGLRQLDAISGEIKRMFVAPSRRGSGVSVSILRQLEETARKRGWSRLLLETGDGQPDAERFYAREGYTRIDNFGHYVDSDASLCFGKNL